MTYLPRVLACRLHLPGVDRDSGEGVLSASLERPGTVPKERAAPSAAASPARILLVDDDADTRELMATALSRDGWQVSQAGDADGGLRLLREGGFRLVISDYELPDQTGAQLLGAAAGEGLLQSCAVLVVTGHPDPADVGSAPVIRKPFDIDALRRQVKGILDTSKAPAAPPRPAAAGIELVLYVARGSPPSKVAERNARRILERHGDGAAALEVRDVAQHPEEAERDRILFVPTLVVRCSPPIWLVGNLKDPSALLGILSLCCAPATRPD
jgi:DNA-binding response OmpR family regulator